MTTTTIILRKRNFIMIINQVAFPFRCIMIRSVCMLYFHFYICGCSTSFFTSQWLYHKEIFNFLIIKLRFPCYVVVVIVDGNLNSSYVSEMCNFHHEIATLLYSICDNSWCVCELLIVVIIIGRRRLGCRCRVANVKVLKCNYLSLTHSAQHFSASLV